MAKKKQEKKEEKQEKKRSKLKLFLLIFLVLGILGAGGFFAYKYFFDQNQSSMLNNSSQEQKQQEKEKKTDKKKKVQSKMVDLPSLLVNLADPLGRRYLKMTASVEVRGEKAQKEVQDSIPKIKDSLIMLLSSKTYDQLSSMSSKLELKKEIVSRLNQILGSSVVQRVYFTEFVIQ